MGDGSGATETTQHFLARIMAGDVENVRQRLASSLPKLGYIVLEEQPALLARRAARDGMEWQGSTDVLDYPCLLVIRFKPLGAASTQVTFDYTVKSPYCAGGDKQVLTREAEALIALAARHNVSIQCAACGVVLTAETRYCRQCGAPVQASAPAELEVLRLTAQTSAAHQSAVLGAAFLLLACLLPFLLFFLDQESAKFDKTVRVIAVLATTLGGCGWAFLLMGLWRLHRTVHPKQSAKEPLPAAPRPLIAPSTAPLPAQQSIPSITENTTDLLPHEQEEGAKIPLRHRDRNTA
jgi:hypothetical protein